MDATTVYQLLCEMDRNIASYLAGMMHIPQE